MSLETYRKKILAMFGLQDVIAYSLGKFDGSSWEQLRSDVDQWWIFYKEWERQDTLAKAYQEKRLTVKGTSLMDREISAKEPQEWGTPDPYAKPWSPEKTYNKPTPPSKNSKFAYKEAPQPYKIVKTNKSIADRLKPEIFMPSGGGESRKTELGLHDLSAGLMSPDRPLSDQQYKTPGPNQIYVFMPLSHPGDQAVFQNINMLAKAYREQQGAFYAKVREIRSKMTRIKLAAEHDMATNFVMVGRTPQGRPKFKFTLMQTTDVSVRDQQKGLVPPTVDFKGKKILSGKHESQPTTPGILEARQHAALNFQSLLLDLMSYGEVVIAYRQHAGAFPKFATFANGVWTVGTLSTTGAWKAGQETFLDRPT